MENTTKKIWATALRKIEIRSHSRLELHQKLMAVFPKEEGLIMQTLDEMERVHLLSDRRFTEEYVAHLTQKNIGMVKIKAETRKRGLNSNEVEQALLDIEWSEEAAAERAIEEKTRLLRDVDERKKKEKLINFLRNRGFRDAIIFASL